ncbi:MAG: LytTR family DNA-binding domain-containing protein [Chitinophagaceae bacterium]|nr:LytTR family DNA-binding domain-containing protein [Chitinophagaceae bacterium]
MERNIRAVIIDDEPLARKGLMEYINEIDIISCVGEFDSVMPAMEIIRNGEVDLLLLDIQMPLMSGLELVKTVNNLPPVIFTTAYPQYAVEGFELNALDYLVKPVSFERFYKAVVRAQEAITQKDADTTDHFFIKVDGKLVRINFAEILFVEALQNYVVIQTRDKKYMTYLTFKAVEEYLPAKQFIRIHKSFIVSAPMIENVEGNIIRMQGHELPISRNMKEEVMEKLLKGKYLKR